MSAFFKNLDAFGVCQTHKFVVDYEAETLYQFGVVHLGQEFDVDYADITYREILCKVRDMIYEGHKLLTHPLSGSVKPNETPYKSILVAKKTGKMDVQDASIIENSIITADKFSVKFPEMPQSVREDFQLIDSTLIRSALMSIPDIF